MNDPGRREPKSLDHDVSLADRFKREAVRAYLTGADALVRLLLMQRWGDESVGKHTAGFVSGYPGSPLGGFDSLLRAEASLLAEHGVQFQPGLNEDLAATSIWGTQYLNLGPLTSRYAGVFGLWYGKGPGLERSTDAMRTASYQGTSPDGGVLAVAGDDHWARSTVTAQQSETLFVHMLMPVLAPSSVPELIEFGLAGWAMSRFASTWVGLVALNDIVDSAATVDLAPRGRFIIPEDVQKPPAIVPYEGVPTALTLETHLREFRLPAAQAFVRANGLDRVTLRSPQGRLGIVTAGKAHLDVMDALDVLGLSPARASGLGMSVLKLAMPWPIDAVRALDFLDGLEEVIVVEAKAPIIEDQVHRLVSRLPPSRRPRVVGKLDERGIALLPSVGGLDAQSVAAALAQRLEPMVDDPSVVRRPAPKSGVPLRVDSATDLVRAPGFCSGCPHSLSTKVPEGSFALSGTGCHGMAKSLQLPGRNTVLGTHMGGEGALWIGLAPFCDVEHTFQNMGDGTYAHSGALAVRAAVAAGVTMTFKILLNGAIAMTGGQPLPTGLTAPALAAQLLAEGVREVVVVSEDPARYGRSARLPTGVAVHPRSELLAIERRLRVLSGVTALIYDQPCAAELRRDRRRGRAAEPDTRVMIHPLVCEGCGDCNVESNCISVEPVETALGRKRRIDQSSCNVDYSCLAGYCPSFVTLKGARPRRTTLADSTEWRERVEALPRPACSENRERSWNMVVAGIGGSGVLTIGAIVGMAAHLEGKSVSVLNESGMAQKNGAVQSHVRISNDKGAQLSPRIGDGSADLLLAADLVVATATSAVSTLSSARTTVIANTEVRPTVAFSTVRDQNLAPDPMARWLSRAVDGRVTLVAATALANAAIGDAIGANMVLLGAAAQRGLVPVTLEAIDRAIELNGVDVEANKQAVQWGRLVAHDPTVARDLIVPRPRDPETLEQVVRHRSAILVEYQDERYAQRYRDVVARVAALERHHIGEGDELALAVAQSLFKTMAYKDEYEVARLYCDPAFHTQLKQEFERFERIRIHLAPQIFNARDPRSGRARKWAVPAEVALPIFRLLAGAKRVRGTRLDVFGRTAHRRRERERIVAYELLVDQILEGLTPHNHATAVELASAARDVQGFDSVKDAALDVVEDREREILARFLALPHHPQDGSSDVRTEGVR